MIFNLLLHTHCAKLKRLQRKNHAKNMSFLSSSCLLDSLFLSLEASINMFLIYPCKKFYEYLYFVNNKTLASKCVSHMQLLGVK